MNRLATIALLLLAIALPARALSPVTVETIWTQKTFSISTTGVTSATFDIGGFGAQGFNKPGGTYTANGTDGTTYGAPLSVTTNTVNVVGFSWSALSIGGDASLKISQTIKMPTPLGSANASSFSFNNPSPMANNFSVPLISTSSAIGLPNNVAFGSTFWAQTANPVFAFTGLTASATLYLTVEYGIPRVQ